MKSSESRRRINLTYKKGQDFWSFYTENQGDLDYIINSSCLDYANLISPEDMKQEILVALHQSAVLDRYDETKARLNSWITTLVRCHAMKYVEREHPGIWAERKAQKASGDYTKRRVLTSELNGVDFYLPMQYEADERVCEDARYIQKLRSKVYGKQLELLDYILQDLTTQEISIKMAMSRVSLFLHLRALHNRLELLASDEIRRRGCPVHGGSVKIVAKSDRLKVVVV